MGYLRSRSVSSDFIVQGKIPEQVSIYSTDESIITRVIGAVTEEAEIRPSFICDKDSKTAHETAKNWAGGYGRRNKSFNHEDRDNTPWEGLRVWDLEARGNGGRAYKVITPDGLYVDLREDTFLEAMLTNGIGPGGELPGQYVFAIMGSQMRLVRVGSDLHTALVNTTSRKKTDTIGARDLQVGGAYRNKAGEVAVFCGFVREDGKRKQFWVNPAYHFKSQDLAEVKAKFDAVATGLGIRYDYSACGGSGHRDNQRVGMGDHVTLRTSHSFIEFLGTIDIGDRTKFFSTADVQKYPEYNPYGYGRMPVRPPAIWEERTWKFEN